MTHKKSKIFFIIFIFILLTSVIITYYKYVILKDFSYFTDEEVFYKELEFYEQ